MSKVMEILEHVIQTMPYNNAEVLFEKDNGRRIRTFGGSCRHQLEEVASRTNAVGIRMKFLGAHNSTHHVGVALENNDMLFVDTAMRQDELVSLKRLFDEMNVLESKAYPQTANAKGIIQIAPTGSTSFSEKVQVFAGGDPVSAGRVSTFDLTDLKDDLPDVDFDLRTTMKQMRHKLFLFGVCPDGNVVHVQMNMNGEVSARLHGEPPSDNGPSLNDLLRKVTEPLGSKITTNDLTDYLSDARAILERFLK